MINTSIQWIFEQPRFIKRIISLLLDTLFIAVAFWAAYILRLDTSSIIYSYKQWWVLGVMLLVTLTCFIRFGLYRAVLRYLSHKATIVMMSGIAISTVTMVLAAYFLMRSCRVQSLSFMLH